MPNYRPPRPASYWQALYGVSQPVAQWLSDHEHDEELQRLTITQVIDRAREVTNEEYAARQILTNMFGPPVSPIANIAPVIEGINRVYTEMTLDNNSDKAKNYTKFGEWYRNSIKK